ncbi:MAG: hypothetical protein J6K16_06050 [Alphaproteobacteria bacterium]|nr:hypothetical protein [Alphaproteobacteria bacterium]
MKTRNLILFVLTAVVCGAFLCADSHAKVCFLGENCGNGGSFSGTAPVNLADECIREGYTARSNCEATVGKYIAEYCPFSSNYGTCCSRENKFASCVYPLQKSGKACGGKYKCVCDRSVYKHTATTCAATNARIGGAACSEEVLTSGSNTLTTNTYYSECRCDRGLYPYYEGDEREGYGMRCHPNVAESDKGEKCTEYRADGSSESFYTSCPCSTSTYPETQQTCDPYQADDSSGMCFSGGVYYYESCTSCDGYPAQNKDHVAKPGTTAKVCDEGDVPGVDCDYSACPNRVRDRTEKDLIIHRCNEPGYRPSVAGDKDPVTGATLRKGEKCIPIDCEVAVKDYLNYYTSSSYAIFDGTKLVDGKGNKVTATGRTAVVIKDMSVGQGSCGTKQTKAATYKTVFTDCTCKARSSGTGNQQITHEKACINANDGRCGSGQVYCCTGSTQQLVTPAEYAYVHGGLQCVPAYNYISAVELAREVSSGLDVNKALKVACTKKPTITYTGANFPYPNSSSYTNSDVSGSAYTMKFYDINFKFTNTTTADNRTLYFYNSKITVGDSTSDKLTLKGSTYLYRNTTYPNPADSVVLINGTLQSNYYLYSNYYQFNPRTHLSSNSGRIVFTTTQSGKSMAYIYLDVDQQFAVRDVYLNPTDGDLKCPPRSCTTLWNSSVYFYGPSTGRASILSNAFVGYNSSDSKYGKNFKISLSRGVTWYLYDPNNSSNKYEITLTPSSSITATDASNGGNVSAIQRSASAKWKTCSMISGWRVQGIKGNKCNEVDNGDNQSPPKYDQNLVCKINNNATISRVAGRALVVGLDLADDDYGDGYKQIWDTTQLGMYAFNAIYECRKGDKNYADLYYNQYDDNNERLTLARGFFSGCNYYVQESDGDEKTWANGGNPFLSCTAP